MADWSKLPRDLLRLVAERMVLLPHFLGFSSVCKEWHSVALEKGCISPPLLLLPFDNSSNIFKLFNLSKGDMIDLHLAELHNRACLSSSHGWLVTSTDELDLQLLHPYTKTQIPLPRHPHSYKEIYPIIRPKDPEGLKSYYVQKIALSTNPVISPDNCVVAGICGGSKRVVFCRLGDEEWTTVDYCGSNDVIFYKNKIYAAATNSVVIICEVGQNPKVTELCGPEREAYDEGLSTCYLVESLEGDLFYVVRYVEWLQEPGKVSCRRYSRKKKYKTRDFCVFKLDRSCKLTEGRYHRSSKYWSRVDCMSNQVLFVGRNQSFALSAEAFPQFKRNCIYFTDDYVDGQTTAPYGSGCHDNGLFRMQDKRVEFLYRKAPYRPMPPIWFQQA